MRPDRVAENLIAQGQTLSWFYNPNNPEANKPYPEPVKKWLFSTDPDLSLTYHPKKGCWQLWQRVDTNREAHQRLYAKWATGYRKLADLLDEAGKPVSPEIGVLEDIMAKIIARRYGGAEGFALTIEERNKKWKQDRLAKMRESRAQWAKDWGNFWKPSVGAGSKVRKPSATRPTGKIVLVAR